MTKFVVSTIIKLLYHHLCIQHRLSCKLYTIKMYLMVVGQICWLYINIRLLLATYDCHIYDCWWLYTIFIYLHMWSLVTYDCWWLYIIVVYTIVVYTIAYCVFIILTRIQCYLPESLWTNSMNTLLLLSNDLVPIFSSEIVVGKGGLSSRAIWFRGPKDHNMNTSKGPKPPFTWFWGYYQSATGCQYT